MGDTRKIRRRQRCPKCGSLDIIKWGVRGSVQRYNANRRKAELSKPEEPPLRMLFIPAQDDRTGILTLDITALDRHGIQRHLLQSALPERDDEIIELLNQGKCFAVSKSKDFLFYFKRKALSLLRL